jgi:hypothetical protein
VEAANLLGAVYKVDFQNPVALVALSVYSAHFIGIAGVGVTWAE